MRLNDMERIALYFFADDSLERTVKRLHLAAALSPRQKVKKMLCELAEKLTDCLYFETEASCINAERPHKDKKTA